jgi:hypothetical protein
MTSGNVWRCIGCSLALLVMPVQAETGREMLERFVASTDAWQADFEQDVYNDQEQLIEKASGSFSLLRPWSFSLGIHLAVGAKYCCRWQAHMAV